MKYRTMLCHKPVCKHREIFTLFFCLMLHDSKALFQNAQNKTEVGCGTLVSFHTVLKLNPLTFVVPSIKRAQFLVLSSCRNA